MEIRAIPTSESTPGHPSLAAAHIGPGAAEGHLEGQDRSQADKAAPEEASKGGNFARDKVSLSLEAQELQKLADRDREVRAHEAAHAAVGGQYAGSPSYTYEKGADGRNYAVGGEVQMNTSKIAGDPQATLQKSQQLRAAALAPAQPSGADRAIAAKATQMAMEAQAELAKGVGEAEGTAEDQAASAPE
ncbi:MAG: hypothetical protein C0617_04545 [Desulfuromonas sp.]|nr:putative metalloprotease CJM1_0395 family protein [Desulfuromonas sp.]PLX85346.1 MAG: hypothetical protein C0617_04545 [Desulfuromonas sp.]